MGKVFIHRSIKTRIETTKEIKLVALANMFLYIDPLKQGLKLSVSSYIYINLEKFLYIDPLKQGLKHTSYGLDTFNIIKFLYIDPLKQGLKHAELVKETVHRGCFYT